MVFKAIMRVWSVVTSFALGVAATLLVVYLLGFQDNPNAILIMYATTSGLAFACSLSH